MPPPSCDIDPRSQVGRGIDEQALGVGEDGAVGVEHRGRREAFAAGAFERPADHHVLDARPDRGEHLDLLAGEVGDRHVVAVEGEVAGAVERRPDELGEHDAVVVGGPGGRRPGRGDEVGARDRAGEDVEAVVPRAAADEAVTEFPVGRRGVGVVRARAPPRGYRPAAPSRKRGGRDGFERSARRPVVRPRRRRRCRRRGGAGRARRSSGTGRRRETVARSSAAPPRPPRRSSRRCRSRAVR